MKQQETIDFNIRSAWQGIARFYNSEAAKHGSTMAVGYALLNIDEEGTPSTKLGPKMGMEPESLTRIIKSMEEKGLICRRTDRTDKRKVIIYLTETGKKKRDISKATVIKFNLAIQNMISKTRLRSFFYVMGQLNKILQNRSINKEYEKINI